MDSLAALLAALAVLVSGTSPADPPGPADSRLAVPTEAAAPLTESLGWLPVAESFRPPVQHQVRIERSITIRISPHGPMPPMGFADLPEEPMPRLVERKMAKCVPISGIAGVQVNRGNRLLLIMHDQRLVSLGLEKACRARDFYAGFYVERSPDGQICVDRDRLQSRSGANCGLTKMRQLVER